MDFDPNEFPNWARTWFVRHSADWREEKLQEIFYSYWTVWNRTQNGALPDGVMVSILREFEADAPNEDAEPINPPKAKRGRPRKVVA